MRTKLFILTVDRSLLTKEERKLKRIFNEFPSLTLEEAKEVLVKGPKAIVKVHKIDSGKTEEELKGVEKIDKPKTPKPKAKPKPKKK